MPLRLSEIYVARDVGETVPIKYLADAPQNGKGPASLRDRTFNLCAPWALGAAMIDCGALFTFHWRVH